MNHCHYYSLLSSKVKTLITFSTVWRVGFKEKQLEVKKLHIIALLHINHLKGVEIDAWGGARHQERASSSQLIWDLFLFVMHLGISKWTHSKSWRCVCLCLEILIYQLTSQSLLPADLSQTNNNTGSASTAGSASARLHLEAPSSREYASLEMSHAPFANTLLFYPQKMNSTWSVGWERCSMFPIVQVQQHCLVCGLYLPPQ